MSYIETSMSWDYVGMTIYPLDEKGQRLTKKVGQDEVEISYYLPDFGLYRVSNSNRYNDILVPTIKSTTVEVPGGDGMYWFGSQHTQKPFTIKFAYDNLEESNLHTLRRLFNGKNRLQIIFDEYPYKYYDVVVSQAPQFDYVPYTEDRVIDGVETPRRIFKGEGSVQLTSYLPYAVGIITHWSATNESGEPTDPVQKTWANWHELQGTNEILDNDTYTSKQIKQWTGPFEPDNKHRIYRVWNGGDMPCDFLLTIGADIAPQVKKIRLYMAREGVDQDEEIGCFEIGNDPFPSTGIEGNLTFDSRLHLIYDTTGKIFNKYLTVDSLFTQIPAMVQDSTDKYAYLYFNDRNGDNMTLEGTDEMNLVYSYKFY